MRILVLRRLLIVLTGLAFLVGAAVQAMPPAEFMASACMGAAKTATGDCCASMAMKDQPAPMKQAPCKGISLDCAKEFGCISSPALPAPSTALGSPTVYGRVAYWSPATWRAGLSIKPDLFPPIANRAQPLNQPKHAYAFGSRSGASSATVNTHFSSTKARPGLEVIFMSSRFSASAVAFAIILAAGHASAATQDQKSPAKPQKVSGTAK